MQQTTGPPRNQDPSKIPTTATITTATTITVDETILVNINNRLCVWGTIYFYSSKVFVKLSNESTFLPVFDLHGATYIYVLRHMQFRLFPVTINTANI